jgi:hypothetical protein
MLGSYVVAEQLAAFREGLSSMELVSIMSINIWRYNSLPISDIMKSYFPNRVSEPFLYLYNFRANCQTVRLSLSAASVNK